jgi:hypothetical protein
VLGADDRAEPEVASETSVIECFTGALRDEEEGRVVRPGDATAGLPISN